MLLTILSLKCISRFQVENQESCNHQYDEEQDGPDDTMKADQYFTVTADWKSHTVRHTSTHHYQIMRISLFVSKTHYWCILFLPPFDKG